MKNYSNNTLSLAKPQTFNLLRERQFSSQYYYKTSCKKNITFFSFVHSYPTTKCVHSKSEQVNYNVWETII